MRVLPQHSARSQKFMRKKMRNCKCSHWSTPRMGKFRRANAQPRAQTEHIALLLPAASSRWDRLRVLPAAQAHAPAPHARALPARCAARMSGTGAPKWCVLRPRELRLALPHGAHGAPGQAYFFMTAISVIVALVMRFYGQDAVLKLSSFKIGCVDGTNSLSSHSASCAGVQAVYRCARLLALA